MNLDYFKNKNLKILFDALKIKYYKTNKLSGTIKIIPNKEEVKEIEKLLRNGKYLTNDSVNIIKISDLEKGLLKTKYQDYSLKDILFYLYGVIDTKYEIKINEKITNDTKYELFYSKYKDIKIIDVLKKEEVIYLLNKDEELLINVFNALKKIPKEKTPLSVFSTQVTKNPHYFDLDTKNASLLIKFLALLNNGDVPKKRVDKVKLLNKYNIITDNYSNYIMTYNLYGEIYLDYLANKKEVVNLNLNNILNLNKVYSKNKKIIILENPSVLDYIKNINTDYGIIIGGGNPNIAFYELLDKLSDHKLYYNGDYDPEGLLIANKLVNMYSNLELILYDKEYIIKYATNDKISDSRIKILDNIEHENLKDIVKVIKDSKNVSYQEEIIDEIIKFIKKE